MSKWLVIGISGVTCGGKSTLAKKLHNLYPKSRIMCMDNFFLSVDDPRHIKAPGLTHNNWERLGAMDVDKWKNSLKYILSTSPDAFPDDSKVAIPNFDDATEVQLNPTVPVPTINQNLLILDGFLALNEPWTVSQCHLKFYVTLTKDQCWERRKSRTYDPPDIPGYFENCVWPEHVRMKSEMLEISPDTILLDGAKPRSDLLDLMLNQIAKFVE